MTQLHLSSMNPDSAAAWARRGMALAAAREHEQALVCLGRALQAEPLQPVVMEHFAASLMALRRYEEAALVLQRLLQLEPGRPLVAARLLHLKHLMGDWLNLEPLQRHVDARLRQGEAAAEPFGLQGWCADPALLCQAAVAHAARLHPQPRPAAAPLPAHGPRIRIGYLAGEFREQATALLLTGVLEHHDRSRFEVFAFDNGWDDGSERRRRIEAACQVVPISALADADAARRVRELGIDVLVNLNGWFGLQRNGIFARRPAPVQVGWLGWPGTMGAPYIDYLLADRHVLPEAMRSHFVEQVVWLPHCYQANDNRNPVAAEPATRADADLPEGAFVFCCLNNAYKIVPAMFGAWMRLLQQVPGSVLLLLGEQPALHANLRHEAAIRGVAPERLLFAPPWPHAHHLRRLQLCDLFLDTAPYNAHTTGSDALWAGLPLLTLCGGGFPGRVGASLLHAVGLPELITTDLAGYEALALQLATQPGRLGALRARLAAQVRSTPLYDTARFTQHLEAAFAQMAARARAGLPAQAFSVAA